MIDQSALDEVFPNNPITEVAFEIRFPTNLRIIPRIYEVQEWLGLGCSGPQKLDSISSTK